MQESHKRKSALIKVIFLTVLLLSLVIVVAACSNSYTVTFDTGGGGEIAAQTVKQGEKATKPETRPYKIGYNFDDWFKEGKTSVFKFEEESITANTTVYAKYNAIIYYIVYNKNNTDAKGTTPSSTHAYDAAKELTVCGFSLTGYAFMGWNTEADGSGTAYTDKQSIQNLTAENGKTINLYAQWSIATYSITYKDVGGGNFSGIHGEDYPQSHTYGIETELVFPTKTGCLFEGWFLTGTGSGESVFTLSATGVTANITLYAKWSGIYNITYKDAGGSDFSGTHGNDYPINHSYGAATILVTPTKPGYTFNNWYLTGDCSGNPVTILSATAYTADITLYAKWTLAKYSITYREKDGTLFAWDSSVVYPKEHEYNTATTLVSPVKANYIFNGWFLSDDFSDDAVTVLSATGYTANIVLYAKWTGVSLSITYKDGGDANFSGTLRTNSPTEHIYGTASPLLNPTKASFRFDGWFLDKDCSGSNITTLSANGYTAAVTLYAKWLNEPYYIIYKEADGSAVVWESSIVYPARHTYNTATTLVNPTKTNYTFNGWYLNPDFSGSPVTSLGATAYVEDITLYAKWTPKTYTITYKDVGNTAFSGTLGTNSPLAHTYNTATTLVKPRKNDHAFRGWFLNPEGTGTALTSLSATGYSADITLYAKWEEMQVYYNLEGTYVGDYSGVIVLTLKLNEDCTGTLTLSLMGSTVATDIPITYTVTGNVFTLNTVTVPSYDTVSGTGTINGENINNFILHTTKDGNVPFTLVKS